MSIKKCTVLAIFGLFLMIGCSNEPRSVEYYEKHTSERDVLISKFRSNPSKFDENDENLKNALEARHRERSSRHAISGTTPDPAFPDYPKTHYSPYPQTQGPQGVAMDNLRRAGNPY